MTRNTLDLGSWIILRMSSGDTLKVAASLTAAGLEVWTPIERSIGRMGVSRTRIRKEAAMMPSYAFGRVEHIDELLRLAMTPRREHPRFTVFHHKGGVPLIADDQLDAIRGEEVRSHRLFERFRRRGKKGPKLEPGSEVKLPDGPFAGFTGIVEDQQGQFTAVGLTIFGKPVTIKVASLLLDPGMAESDLPDGRAVSARAA
jgi:transcription antitermination factor NusG